MQPANPNPEDLIPGLRIVKDFISKEEEEVLLKELAEQNWSDDLRRKVLQYGWKFQHKTHSIKEKLPDLPAFCAPITQRLVDQGLFKELPDQMIINHYLPGQGILPHFDSVDCFEENIVSLGLGSSCIMEFSHPGTREIVPVFFERRTVVLLSGAARYEWKHSIPGQQYDTHRGSQYRRKTRVSLTWRQVKPSAVAKFTKNQQQQQQQSN